MRPVVVAAALLTAVSIAPRPAQAQLGGLLRRAAGEINNRRNQPAGLTEETVVKFVAALEAEARTADSLGRVGMQQHAGTVREIDAFTKAWRTHAAAEAEARRKDAAYAACAAKPTETLQEVGQGQAAGMSPGAMAFAQRMQNMSDEEREAFEKKAAELQRQAEAAEKSGNMAEKQRIVREIEKLTGMPISPAAASQPNAANQKRMQAAMKDLQKCGTPTGGGFRAPPQPIRVRPVRESDGTLALGPEATQMIGDTLAAQRYLAQLRQMVIGNRPIEAGAAAFGADKGSYAGLRERLVYNYLAGAVKDEEQSFADRWKDEEFAALQAHKAELVAAYRKVSARNID